MSPTKTRRSTLHSSKITLLTSFLFFTLFSSIFSLPRYTSAQSTDYSIPIPVSGGAVARTRTNLFILGGASTLTPTTPTDQFITLDLTTPWPATRPAWRALNPGPANYIYPATFTLDQKRMLVFHLPPSNYVYEFKVDTGVWVQSTLAFTNMKWQGVGAVTDPSTGLIYLAAGYMDGTRSSMDIYNPTAQTISNTKLPDLSGPAGSVRFEARWFYGNVWCASRKSILYWGGYHPMGPLPTENVVTELTIGTMTWTSMKTTGTPPSRRADHCMAISEDGSRMVVFGGRVNNAPNNETFVLNTATGAWTQGPSADSRMYPACTIVGDLLLVWGGTIPGEKIANGDMLIYNYITSMWLNSYTPPASLQDLVPPKIPTTVTLGTNSPTSPSSPSSTVSRPPVTSIGSPSGIATQGGGGDNDTSSNLGAVVGGVVGALAVVLAVFMLYRRKQQQGSAQKEVPLLSVKTTNSDNNSTNNSNHGDDDDEQDSAKKYVAGFGPIQSIRLMDKQTLGRGSDGYASSAAVVGTPEQGPQAIVQMGNSPMNMRLRDLEIQQQQLDLKWQLLMLQQQEQQLRSPIQQQLYQQQQQQLQLQQQQQQQQQSQLQQQIYQLGGREARGTVVSANTSVGSTNMRSLGSYTRQEYDDFSSFHTSTPPTVHTCLETGDWNRRYSNLDVEPTRIPNNPHPHPETDLWNRVYSNLDVEPIRIPNNPHTSVPH